jgi:hypothetical protein
VVEPCPIHHFVDESDGSTLAPKPARLVKLVRRREVLLPTIWGWLLLLALLALAAVIAGRGVYPFLAVSAPSGGKILAIEGWMDPYALDQAVEAFRKGGYELAVTTGAPVEKWPKGEAYATAAERAADYLRSQGLPPSAVAAAPSPASAQDRTFMSAVIVREWTKRSGIEVRAIDVFSVGAHARRSRYLYQKAFGHEVKVGVVAGRHEYANEAWWRSAEGAREVLDQAIAYVWIVLFFRPPAAG